MRKILVIALAVVAVVLLTAASPGQALAAGPAYHVVYPGETLSSIASAYGVSSWSVAYANGIWNPNLIYVGQMLVIPSSGYNCYGCMSYRPYPQPYPHPYPIAYNPRPSYGCNYWVRYGDTLSSIAARYGTNTWSLSQANGIYNPNWIYAGQRLVIPGCSWN